MQDREPIFLERSWLPRQPAGLPDVLGRNRDDALVLREPYGARARPFLIATVALAASFALGWAGALHWPEVANLTGADQIAGGGFRGRGVVDQRSEAMAGDGVGTQKSLDFNVIPWWRARYRAFFLHAMSANGNSWLRDRHRVTAVGRFLGQRALHHAGDKPSIDLGTAALASNDVETGCRMNAEREGVSAPRQDQA